MGPQLERAIVAQHGVQILDLSCIAFVGNAEQLTVQGLQLFQAGFFPGVLQQLA